MTSSHPAAQGLVALSLALLHLSAHAGCFDATPRSLGLTFSQEGLPAAATKHPFHRVEQRGGASAMSSEINAVGASLAWPEVAMVTWHTLAANRPSSTSVLVSKADAGWQRLRRQVVLTPDISGSDGAMAFPALFALSGLIRLKKRKPSSGPSITH